MEWKELEKMTVTKLREEALKHPDQLKGVHARSKAQLMNELAAVLGIQKPQVSFAEKVVHTKDSLKQRIRELKAQRDRLIEEHNSGELKTVRRQIHHLKREIRKIERADLGRSKA